MRQFEKWCDEIEYLCVDYIKRDSMRRGWKAALEFVLNNYPDDAIYEIIKKELGNGSIRGIRNEIQSRGQG